MIVKCSCGKLIAVFPLQKKTKLELKVLAFVKGKEWVDSTELKKLGIDFVSPRGRAWVLNDLIKNNILVSRYALGGGKVRIKQVKLA